jgi:ureidoacrylate peracid hydrolase
MLTTFAQKVHPDNAALIVIDMQNDFCSPGGVFPRLGYDVIAIQSMIPRLANLVEQARSAKVPIIFVKSSYNTSPNWFLSEVWFEHKSRKQAGVYTKEEALKPGTWGWDLVEDLKILPEDAVVYKHRYNAFHGTDLDLILRSRKIKSIIFTGMTTNVCVESTARDAFFRDYYVVFTSDCTATWETHLHQPTLENIERYFGLVVESDQIVQEWTNIRVTARLRDQSTVLA